MNKAWEYGDEQYSTSNGRVYNAYAAIALSRDITPTKVEIKHINRAGPAPNDNYFSDFVEHVQSVLLADTSHPIILSEFGAIIDGHHRLAKSILDGNEYILVVQFDKDPPGMYELERVK